MKATAAALRELQDDFYNRNPKPNVRNLAKMANLPYATAARYLNGTTKQGIPSTVRALAIVLGRQDIADELTSDIPTKIQEAVWVVETQREMQEAQSETLAKEHQLREESEKRMLAELERITSSRDKTIEVLSNQLVEVERDKAFILAELDVVRRIKRRRDVLLTLSLLLNVALACVLAFHFSA